LFGTEYFLWQSAAWENVPGNLSGKQQCDVLAFPYLVHYMSALQSNTIEQAEIAGDLDSCAQCILVFPLLSF